ncbi:hypothetical protein C1882_02085 [Pseudomonas sp. FW305-E2]|nr:hypothetical protein C1882_02085 [Pseudomonas sp. FW305-E2]
MDGTGFARVRGQARSYIGHASVVGHRPSCRSGFTREEAGPAGQAPPADHRCRRHRIRVQARSRIAVAARLTLHAPLIALIDPPGKPGRGQLAGNLRALQLDAR